MRYEPTAKAALISTPAIATAGPDMRDFHAHGRRCHAGRKRMPDHYSDHRQPAGSIQLRWPSFQRFSCVAAAVTPWRMTGESVIAIDPIRGMVGPTFGP